MGAVQSKPFVFTAVALAHMYLRQPFDDEPISSGEIHASNSGDGANITVGSDVDRVATTTDLEPTSTADGEGPSSAAAALTPPASEQPSMAAALEPSEPVVSTHTLDIFNNNSNVNEVSGPANIVNGNPNLHLSSSPGAIINYSLIANFLASTPNPLDVIQTTISTALKGRFVPNAVYDAQLGKGCMSGTRVQVLQSIENWILDPESQQIFWLGGMAGSGKTAIAQTVCSRVREGKIIALGGSFFCSRSTGPAAQRDVHCVVPTLAQLFARQSTEFSEALAAELKRDPDILRKQIRAQIKQLLYIPLLTLKNFPIPILFVIDALDECGGQPTEEDSNNTESHRIVSEMLEALVDFTRESTKLPIKFLVTSRPETHIRDTPISDDTFSSVLHLHTVNKAQVTADIRLYINARLSSNTKLRARFTDADMDMLARLSDGLFIFAATALEHILAGGIDAAASKFRRLLNSTRDGLSSGAAAPLDRMYSLILKEAAGAGQAHVDELQVLLNLLASLLSSRMALSVAALSDLTGVNSDDVRARLSRLHAVVHVPDEDHEPSLCTLHASFGDYLLGRAPSDIKISDSLGNELLARGCLRVMAERLHFNVSRSGSSYEPNQTTRPDTITLSLEYACLQWIYHVAAVPPPLALDDAINKVFPSHFLFWLEVISVLREVWSAASILFLASSTVCLPELSKFFREANAFVTSSHRAITRSAPHIYLSALPFAPKNSLVYTTFAKLCTGLVSVETFGIDRHGGRLIMTLTGHEEGVMSVAYSSDGCYIGSGSLDGTVRIWDTRSGEKTMPPLRSGDGAVLSVAFSSDGQSIAAGTVAGAVFVWSLWTGQKTQRRLSGHTAMVISLSFSSDGGALASASADRSVRLWNTKTGDQVLLLNGHTQSVTTVSFSSDGTMLASGSDDGTIRLWHVMSGEPTGQLLHVTGSVSCLCFSPDGGALASGDTDGMVQLWDLQTRTVVSTLRGHLDWIRCVQFSTDGRSVVSTSNDCIVRIWPIQQARADVPSIVLGGHTGYVGSASFSPDGRYITSASEDRTIRIWDAESGGQRAVQAMSAHEHDIKSVAVSPCSSFIVSGSSDRSARVWKLQIGDSGPQPGPLLRHTGMVWSVTVSSDGCLIASASDDRAIRLWNAETGEAVGDPLIGHEDTVRAVTFSPDMRWLASGSEDRTVRIWDVAKRQPSNIAPLSCTGWVFTVAFSPDGGRLAAGDRSGRIHLWQANTGQSDCEPLRKGYDCIRSIAFSACGTRIVAGGEDKMVCVWDIDTRTQLLRLDGHSDLVHSVAVSADGKLICSGSKDHTVRMWSAANGTLIATLRGHTDSVTFVAFAPDGLSLVSCSEDRAIRVWDMGAAHLLSSTSAIDPTTALACATLEDGWLVGPSGELLVWVPYEYRTYLQRSPCRILIDQCRIAVRVGDDGWHRGANWTSCWRRGSLDSTLHVL